MKKAILTLALLFVFTSMAFASPLTDYSAENTSIDITWRPNTSMTNNYTSGMFGSSSDTFDGKRGTFDWSVTTGLGNNFALQYSQYRPEGRYDYGMNTKELNMLYKMNKNMSVFAGYHRAGFIGDYVDNKTSCLQAGIIAYNKVAEKTTLYGLVGAGEKMLNWEVGVSQEVAKNLELNFNYRYKRVQDFSTEYYGTTYKEDIIAKGFGYGVTYKF